MGKGSSKGHTPREAKDNLKSSQMLSVIDAISEGPVMVVMSRRWMPLAVPAGGRHIAPGCG